MQISATPQKLKQWETLSKKVLRKLDCEPPVDIIKKIVDMKPGAAELLLRNLKLRIQQINRCAHLAVPHSARAFRCPLSFMCAW